MCIIFDDVYFFFFVGRYFLIFDGKENYFFYLKFLRVNWLEVYLNYLIVIGLVNISN